MEVPVNLLIQQKKAYVSTTSDKTTQEWDRALEDIYNSKIICLINISATNTKIKRRLAICGVSALQPEIILTFKNL